MLVAQQKRAILWQALCGVQIWTTLAKPDDSSEPSTGQAIIFKFKAAAVLYTLMLSSAAW